MKLLVFLFCIFAGSISASKNENVLKSSFILKPVMSVENAFNSNAVKEDISGSNKVIEDRYFSGNFKPTIANSMQVYDIKNVETILDASPLVVKMNTAIDIVLDGYRWIYAKDNNITTKLPKIDSNFGKGIYSGKFKAQNGYFTNLATLHRTGDVDFFKIGSSVGINASMGLTVAEAGYKNYSLNILEINQNGTIKAGVGHTSLSMSITLTYSPKCNFTLDYVHFDELSDVKVNITGLGAFQLMFEQLSTWLIGNFEPSLKTIVNKKLYHELNKVLKDKDICKYVPTF